MIFTDCGKCPMLKKNSIRVSTTTRGSPLSIICLSCSQVIRGSSGSKNPCAANSSGEGGPGIPVVVVVFIEAVADPPLQAANKSVSANSPHNICRRSEVFTALPSFHYMSGNLEYSKREESVIQHIRQLDYSRTLEFKSVYS